jgi:DNA/RNA endonuclease G (NUC1)
MAEGASRKVLREAIVTTIPREDLQTALAEATPGRDFNALVSPTANYNRQVFELVDRAIDEGWIGDLVATVLELRAGNVKFVAKVRPVAEALQAGEELPPEDARQGPIPPSMALVWTTLSLGVVATSAAAGALSGQVPIFLLLPLIVAVAFLGFGVWALIAPASALLVGLYVRDQRLIPGLGASGLVLGLALAAAGVSVVSAVVETRKTIPVIAHLKNGATPLANHEIFSEVAASPDTRTLRIDNKTSGTGDARFELRANEFYRFGVRMRRGGVDREGSFAARLIERPERIELDIAAIASEAWTAPGKQATLAVVVESRTEISPNLPAPVREAVALGRSARPDSPPADGAVRRGRAPLGLPAAPWMSDRIFFTHGYDPSRRRPVFAAFRVDPNARAVPRGIRDTWLPDPDLPATIQPNPVDFRGSGFDRGTLVTRSNVQPATTEAAAEVFYMSVVVPQTQQSNRKTWYALERYTTRAADEGGEPVYVIAGPVYRRTAATEDRVLVLGDSATPVPTDLFRVLLRRSKDGGWETQAFLTPNDDTEENDPLRFVTSIAELERLTGTALLPDLPAARKSEVNRASWLAPSSPPSRT